MTNFWIILSEFSEVYDVTVFLTKQFYFHFFVTALLVNPLNKAPSFVHIFTLLLLLEAILHHEECNRDDSGFLVGYTRRSRQGMG